MPEQKSDHDMIVEIYTVLLGKNGDKGLVGDVQNLNGRVRWLELRFWALVALLVGLGVIGGSYIGLLK